jgi:hypothetical protein
MTRRNGPIVASAPAQSATTGRPARWRSALRSWIPRASHPAAVVAALLITVAEARHRRVRAPGSCLHLFRGPGPGQRGDLVRAEAVLAPLAALALILAPRRRTFLLTFAVSVRALALMVVSRYVDIGSFGPRHDLYDPFWFPEKLWVAFGEAGPVLRRCPGSCSC